MCAFSHTSPTTSPSATDRPMEAVTNENIKAVGLPTWSEADQTLAKGIQREMGSRTEGLAMKLSPLAEPLKEPQGGGSDDIGDISWTVPTITLRYPSNIPGLP